MKEVEKPATQTIARDRILFRVASKGEFMCSQRSLLVMLDNQGTTLWLTGPSLLIPLQMRMLYLSPIQFSVLVNLLVASPAVPFGVNSSSCK
jgi:hypothetical protein